MLNCIRFRGRTPLCSVRAQRTSLRYVRVIAITIIISILVSPITAFAGSFPDVFENTIHHNAIEYLKDKGVISGYPDGTFLPDQTINRAEALKMVMIASGSDTGDYIENTFPDVGIEDWFYEYVQIGFKKGIVDGYDDGTFNPGININISESLKIILLSFELDIGTPPSSNPYPDVDASAWYSSYANYSKEKQFIEPLADGNLDAGREITRGEFSQIIYRIMFVDENGLDTFPLSTDWKTHTDSSGDYTVKYPFSWRLIEADRQTIFWKKDEANEQLSWARIFPNSATIVVAVDENEDGLSLDSYFGLIEYDSEAVIQKQMLNDYPFTSVLLPSTNTADYYFELPSGKILVAYTQIGDGENKSHLNEEIRNIIGSVRHGDGIPTSSTVTDKEFFLANVREKILVEGDGQNIMDMFEDLVLIETDTIGIGTGPVDYYYSEAYDVTLKLERDSDTILALSEEKNTAF